MRGRQWWRIPLLVATVLCRAQSAEPIPAAALAAHFDPGQSLRYEFDGIVHASSAHAANVRLNVPEDCSYHLRAVLKFDFDRGGAQSGALSGRVHYQAVRYEGPACAIPPKSELVKSLQNLEAEEVRFDITASGDTRLSKPPAAARCEGVSILLKAAWDLLQVRLSDKAIAPGVGSFPSRRFLYWPDTFVEEMEVAAASMQYRRDVTVAGKPFASLQYKQVFSPADVAAYVETRTEARDFTGTTFVTGSGNVSLLFDRGPGRIVYLHRERTIDDRTMLKYESSAASVPLATFSLAEESTVRWLPEKDSEAWLAELHKFETEPAEEVRAAQSTGGGAEPSLAEMAAASRRNKAGAEPGSKVRPRELADSLDSAPRGFERWQNTYCSGGYCFDLSIAVPEQTHVAEHQDGTVLLLGGSGERTITVAVGPVLDLQYEGLSEEELLQQQAARFVANYLWFAGGSGKKLNFESSSLHDRPAAFSDFTATARDLTPIRGRLALVIGPYGRLAPVVCAYAAAEEAELDAVCQTVTGSLVLH
jgi:hypothetical protein